MAAEKSGKFRQLTIDGGEVSHPPPRPKAKCPACEKWVTLDAGGLFHRHGTGPTRYGAPFVVCSMTGRRRDP
jgi:hypothetical protein